MDRQELVQRFKAHGFKMTPQRRAIIEAVTGPMPHPSAEEIHQVVQVKMPDVSLATVYNTLHELVAMNEAYEMKLLNGVRRYEFSKEMHAHLVCCKCGKIQDARADWPKLERLLAPDGAFAPLRYEATVYGYCADCVSSENAGLN